MTMLTRTNRMGEGISRGLQGWGTRERPAGISERQDGVDSRFATGVIGFLPWLLAGCPGGKEEAGGAPSENTTTPPVRGSRPQAARDIQEIRAEIAALQKDGTGEPEEARIVALIAAETDPLRLSQLVYSMDMGADPEICGNDKYTLGHLLVHDFELHEDGDKPEIAAILNHLRAHLPAAGIVFRGDDTQGDFLTALGLAAHDRADENVDVLSFIRVYRGEQEKSAAKIVEEIRLANEVYGLGIQPPAGFLWEDVARIQDMDRLIGILNPSLRPLHIVLHNDYSKAAGEFGAMVADPNIGRGRPFILHSDVDNTMFETPLAVLDAVSPPYDFPGYTHFLASPEAAAFGKDIPGDDVFAAVVNQGNHALLSISLPGEDMVHFNYVASARPPWLQQITEDQIRKAGYDTVSLLTDAAAEVVAASGSTPQLYNEGSYRYAAMANDKLRKMALPLWLWTG
jgi:hypothetical protein